MPDPDIEIEIELVECDDCGTIPTFAPAFVDGEARLVAACHCPDKDLISDVEIDTTPEAWK